MNYEINTPFYYDDNFAQKGAWCNENGNYYIKEIEADEKGRRFIIAEIEPPTEKELLEQELSQLESWLRAHDYIGVKIATGRAIVSDYATEIAEMTIKASRIDAIKTQLANVNE